MTRMAHVRGAKKPKGLPLAEVQDGRVAKQQLKAKPKRRPKLLAKRKPKAKTGAVKIVSSSPSTTKSQYPVTPDWKEEDFGAKRTELGSGGFSTVYLVENKSRRQPKPWAVLKVMVYSKELNFREADALLEYAIHKPLCHENIVKAFGYMKAVTGFTLIMEHSDRGDLHDYIFQHDVKDEGIAFPKNSNRSRAYIRQLVDAVEYLHTKQKVIHMDIKPENVLVTSGDIIKLTDFGCSVRMKGNPRTLHKATNGGTRNYYPPELLEGDHVFDSTADVWAIGCVTYMILNDEGEHPFFEPVCYLKTEARNAQLNAAIWSMTSIRNTGKFERADFEDMEPNAKTFILQTIGKERLKRPIISQLKRDPWLSQTQ